jgi:glycosyltransferase involved in cell wall biosynthesis
VRIVLVVDSYRGGAGNVAQLLANAWAEAGHAVTLLLLNPVSEPRYAMHAGVTLRGYALSGVRGLTPVDTFLRWLAGLRHIFRDEAADVVVSFISYNNILVGLSLLGMRQPLVLSERTDPAHRPLGFLWERLRPLAYGRAQAIVVQTERAAAFFRGALARRTRVIPNPVVVETPLPAPRDDDRVTIMALGRLNRIKGFDLLIRAFAQLHARCANTRLRIVGEGPDRSPLEAIVAELGVGDAVELPGHVNDTSSALLAADIFVLSSRVEGFPNALCEAMALGRPVVAFDCPSGPSELITHDTDGLLVPREDVDALAAALERMVRDPALRARLGDAARGIVAHYGLVPIRDKWLALMDAAILHKVW